MAEPTGGEAVVHLDAAGRYVDANSTALELLGVSLAELRASPSSRFDMRPTNHSEQAELRAQWESGGSHPLVGTTGLKRADGTTIRVSYAIETDGAGFRARLRRVEGSPDAPSSFFSVGEVLRGWRAAERVLAELVPGTPEWERTLSEVEMLRGRYQELFRRSEPQPGG